MLSRNGFVKFWLSCVLASSLPLHAASSEESYQAYLDKYPYVFHLVQKRLWDEAVEADAIYYPPTYEQDEFTHATANPDFLLTIGNHFYQEVEGDWLCLRMSVDSLAATDVETIFEGTAPVGDKEADFEGTDSELFPHILGGIHPSAVLEAHKVSRNSEGRFISVADIVTETTLYHIVSEKELRELTVDNIYTPASIELEGYIHFSKLELILPIANDAYSDREVLYLLEVTFDNDDADLRWIGDNPDFYRGLDLGMVDRKIEFARDENGLWALPDDMD